MEVPNHSVLYTPGLWRCRCFCPMHYAAALPAKPAICFGVPKKTLWGPKFSAMCGARGMFGSNEGTATTREAWLGCLLIRARKAAALGHVVVARPQQL
jgi:hypothetical protein